MFDEFKINVIIEMNMIIMTSMMLGVHWVCESFAFGFEIVVAGAFEIVQSEIVVHGGQAAFEIVAARAT